MATHVPSFIRAAAEDPKNATESNLVAVCEYYSDAVEPEALDLVSEELSRRGVDDFMGDIPHYETYI